MPAPWERRENETTPAWAAFICFRDMGFDRRIPKVAQALHKSGALMRRWSAEHDWEARTRAWDEEIDRRSREANAQAIVDMRSRHAALATLLQQKALERLQSGDIGKLSARDVLAFVVEAAKLERLSRGEPGESISLDVQRMSDEDLIAAVRERLPADEREE